MTSVAISTDSKWIVTAAYDTALRLWDLQNDQELRVLEGYFQSGVKSVAISSDSKFILTETWADEVFPWELSSGRKLEVK